MIEEHLWIKGDRIESDGVIYRLERMAEVNGKTEWYGWRESDGKLTLIPWKNVQFIEHTGAWFSL